VDTGGVESLIEWASCSLTFAIPKEKGIRELLLYVERTIAIYDLF
jgi:hypothetical protein